MAHHWNRSGAPSPALEKYCVVVPVRTDSAFMSGCSILRVDECADERDDASASHRFPARLPRRADALEAAPRLVFPLCSAVSQDEPLSLKNRLWSVPELGGDNGFQK
jgi:hypothetical protein